MMMKYKVSNTVASYICVCDQWQTD